MKYLRRARTQRLPVEFAEATPVAGRMVVTVWDAGQRLSIVMERAPQAQLGDQLFLEFPAAPNTVYDEDHVPIPDQPSVIGDAALPVIVPQP